jgi:serine/threonine-protein kinase
MHRGETVSLTVSRGPELVQVPSDLRGMGIDAARSALENLGFHVRLQKTDFYVGLGYVVGSDPDPGTMAPHGSTVILKIV